MTLVKYANLGLSFLLELCLLAAFAYWGIRTGHGLTAKILLGLGMPLLAAVFWGVFLSPRASVPVHPALNLVLKVILFGLAVIALAVAGRTSLAWVLASVFLINNVLHFI